MLCVQELRKKKVFRTFWRMIQFLGFFVIMLSPILSVVSKKDWQRTRICKPQAAQD